MISIFLLLGLLPFHSLLMRILAVDLGLSDHFCDINVERVHTVCCFFTPDFFTPSFLLNTFGYLNFLLCPL